MKTHTKEKIWGAASVLLLGAASLVPVGTVLAEEIENWGPERPTYTWNSPADHVTFNSMTDNPSIADERLFTKIREANTSDTFTSEPVEVEAGKTYEIQIYYHNNAAANLNTEQYNYVGLAQNVRIASSFPSAIGVDKYGVVTGSITTTTTTASPSEVWSNGYMISKNQDVTLSYVSGSATLHNSSPSNGTKLDATALFNTEGDEAGVLISYNYDNPSLVGIVPGCNEYAGYVTYQVKVDSADATLDKTVSVAGANTYTNELTVKPGDVLDFKIMYKNSGTVVEKNVVLKDTMPVGLAYVAGTTYMKASSMAEGAFISDNLFSTSGINVGDYAAGDSVEVTYKVEVTDDTKIFPCGTTTVYNNSSVASSAGIDYDKVKINVTRDCGGTPTTPSELPTAGGNAMGPGMFVGIVLGLGWIGFGVYYYLRARFEESNNSNTQK